MFSAMAIDVYFKNFYIKLVFFPWSYFSTGISFDHESLYHDSDFSFM